MSGLLNLFAIAAYPAFMASHMSTSTRFKVSTSSLVLPRRFANIWNSWCLGRGTFVVQTTTWCELAKCVASRKAMSCIPPTSGGNSAAIIPIRTLDSTISGVPFNRFARGSRCGRLKYLTRRRKKAAPYVARDLLSGASPESQVPRSKAHRGPNLRSSET